MLFLTVAVALAATAPQQAAQASSAVQEQPQSERKVCRTNKATGSLTRRNRICLTQAQWRELNDRTQRGVQDLVGGASGSPACVSTHDAACGTAPGPGGALPVPTGSGL